MNRRIAVVLGLLASLAAPGAQASDMNLRMDQGSFYVGAGAGRSEQRDICNGALLSCDAKDFSWNIFAGYQFNRHFAAEIGYLDFGKVTASGFVGGANQSNTMETNAVELLGIAALPFNDRFSVYVKGGVFYYDSDSRAVGAINAASSNKHTEFTYGIGAEFMVMPNVGARVEWQRYLHVRSDLFRSTTDLTVVRASARYKF